MSTPLFSHLSARLTRVKENPRKLLKLLSPITGYDEAQQWGRVIMWRECHRLVNELSPENLRALEISGEHYRTVGFKTYQTARFPEYDICASVLDEQFDLIIAEQVFEHLLWPYRAGRNVYQMLNPGGYFLLSTPFLVRVHNCPIDCSRWTELGLKYFLAECGFPLENIHTASWGNRKCLTANFGKHWVKYHRRLHPIHNEPDFPFVVWALAKK